ncbi:MAG: mechanosensitive ion channel [Myxococcota bacterium]
MVKDLISGFFLLVEDVVRVGDLVEVDGRTGTVEEVGLRVTKLRVLSGQLWYIPNGEITNVGNFNREWTRAIVEVGLAYEQDVGKACGCCRRWATPTPRTTPTWSSSRPRRRRHRPQRLRRGRAAAGQGAPGTGCGRWTRAARPAEGGVRRAGRGDPVPAAGHLPAPGGGDALQVGDVRPPQAAGGR